MAGEDWWGGEGKKGPAKKEDRSALDTAKRVGMGGALGLLRALDVPRAAVDKLNDLGPTTAKLGNVEVKAGNLVPIAGQVAMLSHLKDDTPKGVPGFARNLAVDVAMDPTTYLTFGAGSAAKAGLKAVGKEFGEDVAKEVTEKGAKAVLTPSMREQLARTVATREGGSEKAAQRLLTSLDRGGQGGVKMLGRTVVPGKHFAPVTQPLAQAKTKVLDSTAGRLTIPRAGVQVAHGRQAAQGIGAASSRARALASRNSDNVVRGIEQAVRDSKATTEDLRNIVLPALDVPGAATPAVPEHLVPLVEHLKAVRTDFTDRQLADNLLPRLRETDTYVPLDYTEEGLKALGREPGIGEKFGKMPDSLTQAGRQGGHVRQRTTMPGAPIKEVERQLGGALRDAGALKGDLVETNPAVLIGRRAAYAEKALAHRQFVDDVAKLTDDTGKPLLIRATAETARPEGYVELGDEFAGKFYAPKEVADEVAKVREVITNDKALQEFQGLLGRANTWWKGMATAGSIVTGGRYFWRNTVGNVWSNYLAGVTNPKHYAKAAHLQRVVANRGVEGLSASDRRIFDLAEKHGVVDGGFAMSELTNPAKKGGRIGRAAADQRGRRAAVALNPFNSENAAIRGGRAVHGAIENHARMTHFIGKLDELGDAEEAAASVRKYLFDYGDKAPLDRAAGQLAGFWTWRRKNLPLQIEAMAQQPGKFTSVAHAQQEALASAEPGEYEEWALREGMVPVADGRMLVGVDLPMGAAAEMVQPTPENVLGQLGGLVPSLAKATAEQVTGRSLFTGYDIKQEPGLNPLTEGSYPRRLIEAGVPLTGQLSRAPYTAYATGDPQAPARLLTATTGAQARVPASQKKKKGKAKPSDWWG